ncbi:MAG TPA: conjugal transfer protein TrbF [Campylobacterales bacterium]|nr:conjugal transfer protein TrbF [Campylobacterales bacterium]
MPNQKNQINSVYLDARREWNERYGSYIKQAHIWKIISLLLIIITLISVGGFIYTSSQNRFIPYIVQIDKLGEPISTFRAKASLIKDPKIIKFSLSEFIVNYRTVYNDKEVQVQMIKKAYNYLSANSPAYNMLTQYFVDNPPFHQNKRVVVKVISVLQLSKNNWQIDWEENTFNSKGELTQTENYKGITKFAIVPPTSEDAILKNPIGLYITEFNFNKKIK